MIGYGYGRVDKPGVRSGSSRGPRSSELGRERAADQVRAAQRSGDLAGLAQAQTDLELADTASRRAQQKHEFAGAILTRELETWSKATAHRVRLALSDRSGATRR